MVEVPWSSKIGFQVVPAFVVFQRPPEASPTYIVLWPGASGTAMAVMRPEGLAGPMNRNLNGFRRSGVRIGSVRSPGSWANASAAPGARNAAPATRSIRDWQRRCVMP